MPWRDGSFPKGFARENVYPAEVEKVVLEHPAVLEVSVIGVPDPKYGEGIKAVCVLKPMGTRCGIMSPSAQELIDFVAGRIARYKKPNYVQFYSRLLQPIINKFVRKVNFHLCIW